KPLTIAPKHNSNEDFAIKVTAQAVDKLGNITVTGDESNALNINVRVKGVADDAEISDVSGDEVNNVPRKEYAEAELDDGTASINLSELATIELHDDDGSEKLTVRITDLPEGFSVSKGELLTANETGEGRVWLLTEEQYNSAVIDAPHNFS